MDLRAAELLDIESHTRLAAHIAAREPEAAERLARDLLARSVPPPLLPLPAPIRAEGDLT